MSSDSIVTADITTVRPPGYRPRRRRINTDLRAARLVPVLLALGMAGSWWTGHLLRVW